MNKGSFGNIASKIALCAVAIFAFSASANAEGDAVAGEKIFKKCRSCHKIGDDARNGVGPVLTGVVGRQAGAFEGYKYGADLKAAGEAGLIWTQELLIEYIGDSKAFVRTYLNNPSARIKMNFRLKGEEDRQDVIAYLATFSGGE